MANKNRQALLAVSAVGALALAAGHASGQTACGGATGPDVIVGSITGPANYTAASGIDALSLGTTSCNMGNQQLRWDAFPANTHPAIAGNLYRFKQVGGAGRFEQVGMSWLKHGFTALTGNVCCTCIAPGTGSRLGVGCSDPYTATRNGSQSGLGPRWQVNASTGVFPTGGPANPTWSGSTARRLQVLASDLELANTSTTTRYYGESQYVSPDDAAAGNQNNNVSYIRMSVAGGPTDFTFAMIGGTVRQQPAIRVWPTLETGVTLTDVQVPGDGLYIVGSKATQLNATTWRYEYAVYNMNGDRNIGSVSVPVANGVQITNIGFKDVQYRDGDANGSINAATKHDFSSVDWGTSVAGGSLMWATEPQTLNIDANAIRWGTLYNFRFDANVAPAAAAGSVTLGLWKAGAPGTITAAAQVPGSPGCVADVDDGSGTGTSDGGVGIEDLLYYLAIYDDGVVAADVDDGSGTGTQDGGVGIEDLLYYLARYDSGC